MRSMIWFALLFVMGCDKTITKTDRDLSTKDWIWEPTPSPEPWYACYRYIHKDSFLMDWRYTHIVCFNKPQVTN
jgi:hypothetical protein